MVNKKTWKDDGGENDMVVYIMRVCRSLSLLYNIYIISYGKKTWKDMLQGKGHDHMVWWYISCVCEEQVESGA